jgi:hypothetical protein
MCDIGILHMVRKVLLEAWGGEVQHLFKRIIWGEKKPEMEEVVVIPAALLSLLLFVCPKSVNWLKCNYRLYHCKSCSCGPQIDLNTLEKKNILYK